MSQVVEPRMPGRPMSTDANWSTTVEGKNAGHDQSLSVNRATAKAGIHTEPSASHDADGVTIFDRRTYASDPIELLPASSQKKLLRIRDDVESLSTLAYTANSKWNEAQARTADAQNRYNALTNWDAASRSGYNRIYDPADLLDENLGEQAKRALEPLRAATDILERANKELAQATDQRDAKQHRANLVRPVLQRLEDYLKSVRGTPLAEHDAIEVELKKTETIDAALKRTRRQIATLAADAHSVRSAPVLSAVVKAQARAQVEALAERGRPDVYEAVEIGAPVWWPQERYRAEVILHGVTKEGILRVDGIVDTEVPNATGLMAWLFKDQFIAAIELELDKSSDDEHALSDSDRAQKLKAIADEILHTERQEERLIEMAAENGSEISRRSDCDPRAVLNIIGPAPRSDY